ncbi:hypothetical protein D3C77_786440 [compost metagenome]
MATVNQKMVAFGEIVFTQEEIRTVGGYENTDDLPALPDVRPPPDSANPAQ